MNQPSQESKDSIDQLADAFLALKNQEEAKQFLRDLLTLAELKEFANRFQAAKLLLEGQSYTAVAEKLKMSTTTVTRVAHWLHHGMGGYRIVLNRRSLELLGNHSTKNKTQSSPQKK